MKKLIKQIDDITDFREALRQRVAAKEEAVFLESDAKTARAWATLAHADTSQNERWARIDLDAEPERGEGRVQRTPTSHSSQSIRALKVRPAVKTAESVSSTCPL